MKTLHDEASEGEVRSWRL